VFFDGFAVDRIDLGEVTLRVRHGGAGPAVLLLHGHPRTGATWHRVAGLLAGEYAVVVPDLRGYGASSKPPTTADHETYSKRAMARDCLALMRTLGHDRGGYVAFRTALDYADSVTALAALDVVPIADALARCDARFAAAWWHWFFLGQSTDKPERAINADPLAWYGAQRDDLLECMGAEAYDEFCAAITDPPTVHAMCEDYRAGLGIDRANDEADRAAGRRIRCPVLVFWAANDDLHELYDDILGIWSGWADDVRGGPIDSGHHMAEDAPAELAAGLGRFLAEVAPAQRR
jgi:haloacetate dehalogenase